MSIHITRFIRLHASLMLLSSLLLSACGGLPAPRVVNQNIYVLEHELATSPVKIKRDLVLAVSLPRALAGFDTSRMAYSQKPYELNYFVTSKWADSPARMLEPLIAHALEQVGVFSAVVQTSGTVPADLRLDTELLRLQQDFMIKPSRMRFTMRAQLVDVRGRRLLGTLQIDEVEIALSDDAYGGVTAANRLVQRVLGKLAEFCVEASGNEIQSDSAQP